MVNRDIKPCVAHVLPGLGRTALVTLLASGASIAAAFALAGVFTEILVGRQLLPLDALSIAVLLLLLRALLLWLRDLSALHTPGPLSPAGSATSC